MERNSVFVFQKAKLQINLEKNFYKIYNLKGDLIKTKNIKKFDRNELMKEEIFSFIKNVKKRSTPRVTILEAKNVLEVIQKIKNRGFKIHYI